ELRLAEGLEVATARVAFEDRDPLEQRVQRVLELLGTHEIRAVSRRMVLGELAMAAAHDRTDRQAEARRVVLALVVTVRREVDHPRSPAPHPVLEGAIPGRSAAEAALVAERSFVTETDERDAVADPRGGFAIARQPRERSDRPGRAQEAVGQPVLAGGELAR